MQPEALVWALREKLVEGLLDAFRRMPQFTRPAALLQLWNRIEDFDGL